MDIKYRNNNKEIFAPLKNSWLVATPEEIIRQETICKLVVDYGYELEQMEQERSVTNSKNGNGRARADIVIWKSEKDRKGKNSAFIVIECKAEYIKLTKDDYAQGINYASWTNAQFCVITNKSDWRYFKILSDKIFPDNSVEINGIPHANELENNKRIKEILDTEKFFSKDDFQKLLFECHNVIRNNDKMSPEMAFDEISKVLFMKIMFERDEKMIFSKKKFLADKKIQEQYDNIPFYQKLFKKTKDKYKNDEIFEENATLRIREESFLEIVEKLQNYNLSKTDDDVKGIAFEEFLGTTFRGELGQYFTPRTVVNFMVDILDPQEGELVCDPCCGSGGFLITAFDHIRYKIVVDIQEAKNKIRKELYLDNYQNLSLEQQMEVNAQLNLCITELEKDLDKDAVVIEDGKEVPSRLKKLSSMCIFGTDAEPRSARTAKMNMIMHGDGHGGVHYHDGLWNINGIFEDRFDVIITNPPFGARVSKNFSVKLSEWLPSDEKKKHYEEKYGKSYTEAYKKSEKRFHTILSDRKNSNKKLDEELGENVPLTSFFELGDTSSLTEVLFMERCVNLLKPGGRMGVVLPEGFLNGSDLQRVREYFEGKAKLLMVVSLPQEIFVSAGASVKSSLVFLKKFTEREQKLYDDIQKKTNKEINEKYQPQIEEKEKIHKQYWHEIQRLRVYAKDVKSIRTSKSEKDLQLMLTSSDISEATKKHKEAKIEFDKWKSDLDKKIETEIKALVKDSFDYEILAAKIDKAGITSTGQKNENQFTELNNEFTEYRKMIGLWKSQTVKYEYGVGDKGTLSKTQIEVVT
jgi:type I restriction enzyme M protein